MDNCNISADMNGRDENFFETLHSKTTKLNDVFDEKLNNYEDKDAATKSSSSYMTEEQYQGTIKMDNVSHQHSNAKQSSYQSQYQAKSSMQSISITEDESSSSGGVSSPHENTSGSIWSTIIAKVVTAYRQEESIGKTGLALLINENANCKLIIYRSKTQILGSVLLQKHQDMLSKHRKYWQFYDENGIYWSLYFNDERDEGEFLEQLLAKGYHLIMPTDNTSNDEQEQHMPKSLVEKCSNSSGSSVSGSAGDGTSDTEALIGRTSQQRQRSTKLTPNTSIQKSLSGVVGGTKPELKELSSDIEVLKHVETYHDAKKVSNADGRHYPSVLPLSSNYTEAGNGGGRQLPLNPNPLESQYVQMMLTEQRTLGSELRMNVSRLSEKTEMILNKLEIIDKQTSSNIAVNVNHSKEDDLLELEERLLALRKENRKLKLSLEELHPPSQNATSSDAFTKEILSELGESLDNLNVTRTNNLKAIVSDLVAKCQENKEALHKMTAKLRSTNVSYEENLRELAEVKSVIQKLQFKIKSSQDSEANMQQRVQELQAFNDQLKLELKVTKDNFESKLEEKTEDLECTVKTIMNELYLEIASRLQTDNQSNELTHRLLGIIGATIRHQTLKTLKTAQ